jgi:hypothetical protein
MNRATACIIFVSFSLLFYVFFVSYTSTPTFGAITIELTDSIGYGFITTIDAFMFEAKYAISNQGWYNAVLLDVNATMFVYDVVIYSDSIGQIELPRNGTYVIEIPEVNCVDGFAEIWETFHESDDFLFDFTFVIHSKVHYGVYRGPFEISWKQRLGFIHYPDRIWVNETG